MGDIVEGMWQDGLLDGPQEDDEESEWGGRQPSQPRCKHCGSTEVRWRQQTGRWVLFNLKAGEEHNCRQQAAPATDFD